MEGTMTDDSRLTTKTIPTADERADEAINVWVETNRIVLDPDQIAQLKTVVRVYIRAAMADVEYQARKIVIEEIGVAYTRALDRINS